MENLASPSEISDELAPERLSIIAQLMLEVLHKALLDTSTEHDCAYTQGTLPWGRIRNAVKLLVSSRRHPWLSIKHAGNDLLIGIGSHPVRFFLDDHLSPRKIRVLNPTESEMQQLELLPESGDRTVDLWRFIVERAITEDDEHRVFFVGYNRVREVVAQWQYTDSARTFFAVDDYIPAAAELPPIYLTPIYDDEATSSDSYEANPSNSAIGD
ncbi:hypothetical protein [Stenotrophomonas sp. YIM B06876]|uniref:hypothetical protein n=1 Tax=Stenotrophomonas sp. YIM B06876 TaxID=3060211 RepID=UPI0027387742|nr:hypothetical protein [Stenotrophomonas sp. YIM B06876]